MDTRKIIEGLKERMFGPPYISALKMEYDDQVKAGTFKIEEDEYALAAEYLAQNLSEDRKAMLAQMEADYTEKYSYASTYPFYCGLMCAFEQFFHPGRDQLYDFRASIEDDMNTLPRMKRHREYYEHNKHIFDLGTELAEDADDETSEHITSINCAWDQRVHSASVDAFYIGYRFGLHIIEQVVPLGFTHMTKETLYLEFTLGFTSLYSLREQKESRVDV